MNCTGECCISFKCMKPINYENVIKRCQQECKGCAKYYIRAITLGHNIVNSAMILERMNEVLNDS